MALREAVRAAEREARFANKRTLDAEAARRRAEKRLREVIDRQAETLPLRGRHYGLPPDLTTAPDAAMYDFIIAAQAKRAAKKEEHVLDVLSISRGWQRKALAAESQLATARSEVTELKAQVARLEDQARISQLHSTEFAEAEAEAEALAAELATVSEAHAALLNDVRALHEESAACETRHAIQLAEAREAGEASAAARLRDERRGRTRLSACGPSRHS
ncbi:uncharacterized protein AMSG_10854 [Thecamonas trahens ATCC 50062]|uniref:Uncharacterized protein n=1 Tax=Thecamonas trahens ATCC 50062 TaxID=461836 RepID=A0A0L0DSI0_THETB|nr:hypothetical protein AMSG_10854 [Thecamonas trahens ATCC 50062]KNC55225.1 hypothetical protein AMSG_10854 [Thecamonas trahens ATCC 50062]|eukprot:XP_013753155.1 hypothetical protein AMSG_10854 [Thecamonas trahens ATCC 50062]